MLDQRGKVGNISGGGKAVDIGRRHDYDVVGMTLSESQFDFGIEIICDGNDFYCAAGQVFEDLGELIHAIDIVAGGGRDPDGLALIHARLQCPIQIQVGQIDLRLIHMRSVQRGLKLVSVCDSEGQQHDQNDKQTD